MTLKTSLVVIGILLTASIGIWSGCSTKSFSTSSVSIPANSSPAVYLPLTPGLRVDYTITEPQYQHFDLEVTTPTNVDGHSGYVIRKTDRDQNQISYSYRYVKGNAIFESYSTDDPGERILESPFVVGHQWNRFDTTTASDGTIDNGQDDANNGKGGGTGFDKDKPGQAYGLMSIVGFEDVQALNGVTYGHCLKVQWQISPTACNYYWYYPSVGLVKYIAGNDLISSWDSQSTAVMTDFRVVEY